MVLGYLDDTIQFTSSVIMIRAHKKWPEITVYYDSLSGLVVSIPLDFSLKDESVPWSDLLL